MEKHMSSVSVEKIYSGVLARHYDLSMSHMFDHFKKQAFGSSQLKKGDTVLVYCCGTGGDIPHILDIIGEDGRIIGIDFSSRMLERAEKKKERFGWHNVEFIHADVTRFEELIGLNADVGICTLGMSIIPDYMEAYRGLASRVKMNGSIIIGDMQLASGTYAKFNPLTLFLAKRFGGSARGHQNSREICALMERKLEGVMKREYFLKSYYTCIGTKKGEVA
jgi:ubiquinone/menaquinone biosynthesis C-methylase UbiE